MQDGKKDYRPGMKGGAVPDADYEVNFLSI
jgi:hypothetical protein